MNPRVAASAAAVFLILIVAAFAGGSGRHETVKTANATMPSYCGTKATERLPECGWTEAKEKTPAANAVTAPDPYFPPARLDAMAALVRIHGYSCKTPIDARSMLTSSSGFVLHCYGDRPNSEYRFDIEDRGGRFVVGPH